MQRKIEALLSEWQTSPNRRPLLLHGARQVGKTWSLREFGRRHFARTAYLNLEASPALASLFEDELDPKHLISHLELLAGTRITPGETLLILDEIQSCERALTSLKYFCENAPEYHVAAAGSLLGVAINREHYSFPVGKVSVATLFPLDFEEFLWARGEQGLTDLIREHSERLAPLPEALHQRAIGLYLEYLILGGMPAALSRFLESGSLLEAPLVQAELLDNTLADMAKYASPGEAVKIRACYQSIPAQLAKENHKFQYKVVRKGGSASIFGASIDWLAAAGVVLKCQRIQEAREPLAVYADPSAFKLYMGDVGMLAMKSGLAAQTILANADNSFMGALVESYVACQFAAKGYPLYYWESGGTAELDFVLQRGQELVAVEVKKGLHTRSRSLGVFMDRYRPDCCIRLSCRHFGQENGIRSVPLYAAFCI